MVMAHRDHVEALLSQAAAAHRTVLTVVPADIGASLPVDAQGISLAIEYLATATGLSSDEHRELIRPHSINPAVLHARVSGPRRSPRIRSLGPVSTGAGSRRRARHSGRCAGR
jgi:hypothetical protein